jgi:5'-deoxynucleotidase YfbR-like HD superfamily hydrolase
MSKRKTKLSSKSSADVASKKQEASIVTAKRVGDWIETSKGNRFYPLDPYSSEVDIKDIAHSLSLLCRFNGHCSRFYSVAEHCVHTVEALKSVDNIYRCIFPAQMIALLHDASEAYISDIPRPVKPSLAGYGEIEEKLQNVIYQSFGVSPSYVQDFLAYNYVPLIFEEDVKKADLIMLASEAMWLNMNKDNSWKLPYASQLELLPEYPMDPEQAEQFFLDKFYDIQGRIDESRSKLFS